MTEQTLQNFRITMLKKKLWDLRAISHYEMAKFRGVDTGTKTFKLFLQNVILK